MERDGMRLGRQLGIHHLIFLNIERVGRTDKLNLERTLKELKRTGPTDRLVVAVVVRSKPVFIRAVQFVELAIIGLDSQLSCPGRLVGTHIDPHLLQLDMLQTGEI